MHIVCIVNALTFIFLVESIARHYDIVELEPRLYTVIKDTAVTVTLILLNKVLTRIN